MKQQPTNSLEMANMIVDAIRDRSIEDLEYLLGVEEMKLKQEHNNRLLILAGIDAVMEINVLKGIV